MSMTVIPAALDLREKTSRDKQGPAHFSPPFPPGAPALGLDLRQLPFDTPLPLTSYLGAPPLGRAHADRWQWGL